MRTFTKTEIDLCKKIAEKDFKEITYGDYYSHGDGAWHLCDGHKLKKALDEIGVIPLWQEHDCLEWLREKRFNIQFNFYGEEWELRIYISGKSWHKYEAQYQRKGKTPLEALLRAVLSVMEEK